MSKESQVLDGIFRSVIAEPADYVLCLKGKQECLCNAEELIAPIRATGLVVTTKEKPDCVYLLITAPYRVLAHEAEKLKLQKEYIGDLGFGIFTVDKQHLFANHGSDSFFHIFEKERLIRNILGEVVYDGKAVTIEPPPGTARDPNKPFVDIFPLHDETVRIKLCSDWLHAGLHFPLTRLREYFGDKIAFYFSFLQTYTHSLAILAVLGLAVHLLNRSEGGSSLELWFALFACLWGGCFLEYWKRVESSLAFSWVCSERGELELTEPRPEFQGTYEVSPITGEKELVFSWQSRALRYCVSLPVVGFFIAVAVSLMWHMLAWQDRVDNEHSSQILYSNMPTIAYAVLIPVLNKGYKTVALKLNDWENHRTQSQYENHYVIKRLVFELPNYFVGLFYTALVKADLSDLRSQLFTLLVTMQIVGNLLEVVLPHTASLIKKFKSKWANTPPEPQVEMEAELAPYEFLDSFDDYLELVVQFGFVTFFASAFPLAPLLALANNLIEIRSDGFKLLTGYQRPKAERCKGIEVWEDVFQFMARVAILSNCLLLATTSAYFDAFTGHQPWAVKVIIMLAVEHVLHGLMFLLDVCIPDVPLSIRQQIAKQEYQHRKALDEKRAQELDRRQQ